MQKKGQIALYLVIAIVMLGAFGYGFYYLIHGNDGSTPGIRYVSEKQSLDASSNLVQNYVQSCLEQRTKEGIDFYGIKLSTMPLIENYIEMRLESCIDFAYLANNGVQIKRGTVNAQVGLTEDAIIVTLTFPLDLSTVNSQSHLERFEYNLKRQKNATVNPSTSIVDRDTPIVTEDGDAEFMIHAGTRVYNFAGTNVDQISVKVVDKNSANLSNRVVVGNVMYEGLPSGTFFDPAINVNLDVNYADVPTQIAYTDLKCAYFDEVSKIWRTYQTLEVVDNGPVERTYTVKCLVNHFTYMAAISCGSTGTDTFDIRMYNMFRSPVQPMEKSAGVPGDALTWNNLVAGTASADVKYLSVLDASSKPEITLAHCLFFEKNIREIDQTKVLFGSDRTGGGATTPDPVGNLFFVGLEKTPDFPVVYANQKAYALADYPDEDALKACEFMIRDWDKDDTQETGYTYVWEFKASAGGSDPGAPSDNTKCLDKCKTAAQDRLMKLLTQTHATNKIEAIDKIGIGDEAQIKTVFITGADLTGETDKRDGIVNGAELTCSYDELINIECTNSELTKDDNEIWTLLKDPARANKFFATPRTYGYSKTIGTALAKATLPADWASVPASSYSSYVGGYGEFAFKLMQEGNACWDEATATGAITNVQLLDPLYYDATAAGCTAGWCGGTVLGEFTKDHDIPVSSVPTSCGDGDTCLWTLNNPAFSLSSYAEDPAEMASPDWKTPVYGLLRNGINLVGVWVANGGTGTDADAYAHAVLRFKGTGLVGQEECGTGVQDRINYLCECGWTSDCPSKGGTAETEEMNCLYSAREAKKSSGELDAYTMSLCDTKCGYKAGETVGGYCAPCNKAIGQKNPTQESYLKCKYCPGTLDQSGEDSRDYGCYCGTGGTESYDGLKYKYCCDGNFANDKNACWQTAPTALTPRGDCCCTDPSGIDCVSRGAFDCPTGHTVEMTCPAAGGPCSQPYVEKKCVAKKFLLCEGTSAPFTYAQYATGSACEGMSGSAGTFKTDCHQCVDPCAPDAQITANCYCGATGLTYGSGDQWCCATPTLHSSPTSCSSSGMKCCVQWTGGSGTGAIVGCNAIANAADLLACTSMSVPDPRDCASIPGCPCTIDATGLITSAVDCTCGTSGPGNHNWVFATHSEGYCCTTSTGTSLSVPACAGLPACTVDSTGLITSGAACQCGTTPWSTSTPEKYCCGGALKMSAADCPTCNPLSDTTPISTDCICQGSLRPANSGFCCLNGRFVMNMADCLASLGSYGCPTDYNIIDLTGIKCSGLSPGFVSCPTPGSEALYCGYDSYNNKMVDCKKNCGQQCHAAYNYCPSTSGTCGDGVWQPWEKCDYRKICYDGSIGCYMECVPDGSGQYYGCYSGGSPCQGYADSSPGACVIGCGASTHCGMIWPGGTVTVGSDTYVCDSKCQEQKVIGGGPCPTQIDLTTSPNNGCSCGASGTHMLGDSERCCYTDASNKALVTDGSKVCNCPVGIALTPLFQPCNCGTTAYDGRSGYYCCDFSGTKSIELSCSGTVAPTGCLADASHGKAAAGTSYSVGQKACWKGATKKIYTCTNTGWDSGIDASGCSTGCTESGTNAFCSDPDGSGNCRIGSTFALYPEWSGCSCGSVPFSYTSTPTYCCNHCVGSSNVVGLVTNTADCVAASAACTSGGGSPTGCLADASHGKLATGATYSISQKACWKGAIKKIYTCTNSGWDSGIDASGCATGCTESGNNAFCSDPDGSGNCRTGNTYSLYPEWGGCNCNGAPFTYTGTTTYCCYHCLTGSATPVIGLVTSSSDCKASTFVCPTGGGPVAGCAATADQPNLALGTSYADGFRTCSVSFPTFVYKCEASTHAWKQVGATCGAYTCYDGNKFSKPGKAYCSVSGTDLCRTTWGAGNSLQTEYDGCPCGLAGSYDSATMITTTPYCCNTCDGQSSGSGSTFKFFGNSDVGKCISGHVTCP